MAATRTVLSPTGLIQPQHGLTGYEADIDQNMALLNAQLPAAGQVANDAALNGVYSGLALSTSASLTPGLTAGVLYAQGQRINLASPVDPGPAPVSATNYLFYNSSVGFYYSTSAVGAPGDALIGEVTTSPTAVTAVVQATKVSGLVDLAPGSAGNFTVAHLLGRSPVSVIIYETSAGAIWFQSTPYDDENLYLTASAGSLTGKAQVF